MKWHWMLSIGPAVLWGAACGYHANAFDPQLQPPAGRTIDDAVVEAGGQEDLAGLELPGMRVDVVEESQTEVTIPVAGCMDEAALNYDVEATEDDGSCLYNVTLTFKLDMTCAADETAPQVAGGNTFGMPGDHPMADPDGDHIWVEHLLYLHQRCLYRLVLQRGHQRPGVCDRPLQRPFPEHRHRGP
jgi:hypothetical protein